MRRQALPQAIPGHPLLAPVLAMLTWSPQPVRRCWCSCYSMRLGVALQQGPVGGCSHHETCPLREIRNVELLKLRFGEAPMHFCEVMLKDMADSRRINANIREEDEKRPPEEQPPFGVYAVILSSEFWPPFKEEKLEVPGGVREALEAYCRKYEKLKVLLAPPWAGAASQLETLPSVPRAVPGVPSRWAPRSSPSPPRPRVCMGRRVWPAHCSPPLAFPLQSPHADTSLRHSCRPSASLPLSTLWPLRARVWGAVLAPGRVGLRLLHGFLPRSHLQEVCRLLQRLWPP